MRAQTGAGPLRPAPARPVRVTVRLRDPGEQDGVVRVLADAPEVGPLNVLRGSVTGPAPPRTGATDVVITDLTPARGDHRDMIRELSRTSKVLVVSVRSDQETVLGALRAGAAGYLLRDHYTPRELVQAVRHVRAGDAVLSPHIAGVLLRALAGAAAPTPAEPGRDLLSPRLREVMTFMAQGWSNADIATELCLSEKTVKNHVNHIFARLQVTSRTQAVASWTGMAVARAAGPR